MKQRKGKYYGGEEEERDYEETAQLQKKYQLKTLSNHKRFLRITTQIHNNLFYIVLQMAPLVSTSTSPLS